MLPKSKDFILLIVKDKYAYIFLCTIKTVQSEKNFEPSASAAMTTVPGVKGSFTPVPCFTGSPTASEWLVAEERKTMSETQ